LRNDGGNAQNYLRLTLVGATVNRDAIGALARVILPGGSPSPWAMAKTGSSYLSQSEMALTFGLGKATRVERIEVRWPNGRTETLRGVDANQAVVVTESKGITSRAAAPVRGTR
jgi:hypothetical protein